MQTIKTPSLSHDVSLGSLFNDSLQGLGFSGWHDEKTSIRVERFYKLFDSYGIEKSKIPQLLPCPRLIDRLTHDPARLGEAISSGVIAQLSLLFDVRVSWLMGVCDEVVGIKALWGKPTDHLAVQLNWIAKASHQIPAVAVILNQGDSSCFGVMTISPCRYAGRVRHFELYEFGDYHDSHHQAHLLSLLSYCVRRQIAVNPLMLQADEFEAVFLGRVLLPTLMRGRFIREAAFWRWLDLDRKTFQRRARSGEVAHV